MLTGHEHTDLKITALRLGYDDFIMKSALDQELEAKLTAARRVVSRQRRLDATLRELYGMATRDELTGLHNRRFFFGETDRLLQEGTVANLIFFDLDDFKLINDQYGHLAGDRILRDLGTLFLARTRHEDLIARFGGDEFIMLIGRLAPAEVEGIGSRLAREIGECHWTFGTDDVSLSVTTGIACSSLLELPTVTRLLSACDRDLYKNKWLRKHPAEDPALYAYDSRRDAEIVDLWDDTVSEQAETTIE
jgi:diguanylate cyclase (GGDEF)-like protein